MTGHPQDRSLTEQIALLRGRTLSATELLDATLARIEQRDTDLNSVAATFPDASRAMAATERGEPLFGAPVGIKDMFALPWRGYQNGTAHVLAPPSASGAYRRLDESGAVVAAVTNQHQLGMGTTGAVSAYGPGANPWSVEHCAGGSSGGSAAAVSARLLAATIGSDTGGSTRIPAAYCGVLGLKFTFRSVPYDGYTGAGTTLSAPGTFARDSADLRVLSEALLHRPLPRVGGDALRVGVVTDPFWDDIDPDVGRACRAALDEAGWSVREVVVDGAALAIAASTVRTTSEVSAFLPVEMLSEVDPMSRALLQYALTVPARLLVRADRVRALVRRALRDVFGNVDVVAWPTVPAPAPRLDNLVVQLPSGAALADTANLRQAVLANFTGVPGISIPVGLHPQGLPIGLQLLAPWGAEQVLIDAAAHLEDATGRRHVDAVPPMAK